MPNDYFGKNKWKLGRRYSPAPTEQATPHDIIWAAGIFEGEGSSRYGAGTEAACISQNGRWLVERLQALFGGTITQSPGRDFSMWQIYGARARGFLQSIYGLLSPRRQEQIRKALRIEVD